jgi:hypothetical protein
MELINEKVNHKNLGAGEIISFDGQYIEIQFASKISKFSYPAAFESFLTLKDADKQATIQAELVKAKQIEEDKKRAEEETRRKAEEARKAAPAAVKPASGKMKKSIDELFSEDYHATHLARQPILTYQQVEDQFGIQISGFGRGINPTPSKVVLISSISKSDGKFVYHDKWSAEGDYIYSGEGKSGDQAMTKGNLAIKNAARDGKKIHLFVKFSPRDYYYQGVFELVDFIYENEKDESGSTRKEYKFRLRKVLK